MTAEISVAAMHERWVRYEDLKPCTTAFIDAKTPGSERKENFTIIGPGVAENPDQHVHIQLPHGFNIGGARQPPGCVNSQHSHDTAEVFIILSGTWRFKTGIEGRDGFVDLSPGDTISIPIQTMRGFENIGQDTGFMFAVLGGDVPGRVTWAPYVFDAAARHGLILLASGRLIDTTRERIPECAVPMRETSPSDVAKLRKLSSGDLEACVVRHSQLRAGGGLSKMSGLTECPVIGGDSSEGMAAAQLHWQHGFSVRTLQIAAGARSLPHVRQEGEVLLVHSGHPHFLWAGGVLELGPGDTLTVPVGLPRTFANPGPHPASMFVVRGGDCPQAPSLVPGL